MTDLLPSPTRKVGHHGFSLIELLVVLAIIAIVTALALPNFSRLTGSSNLTVAGQMLVDNLDLARQTALSKSQQVEVRLYQLPANSAPGYNGPAYRALQLFTVVDSTTTPWTYEAITKVIYFPPLAVIVNDSAKTSLLNQSGQPVAGTSAGLSLPNVGTNYQYLSFHFKSNGETDLDRSQNWFVTLVQQNDPIKNGGLPANFIAIQIDPVVGKARVFRP